MLKVSNRTWFKLHGWFSLPVWVLFCFVCLSGTIAVISHELTWLTNPAARASNPDNLSAKPAAELISLVEQAYPSADVGAVISYEPYLVNAVSFTSHDKPYAIAYVNQFTGAIQEVNDGNTFINFMRSLHGWLLFPWYSNYSWGYYLVNVMAFVMLGALITGLVVYKNFWRAFTQPKLRSHQGKQTFLADLHRLAGVWSIWFLLVMSATGLWYLIQAIMWHADIDIEPHPPLVEISQVPLNTDSTPQRPFSLQYAIDKVQQRYADFEPSYIMVPEHYRDTYKLMGKGDFIFYDQYSYSLTVNPWTGAITSDINPDNMTVLQTLSHIADPLHYGTLAGIWTKIIWFLFGALLTSMSITGFMMWAGRAIKAARRQPIEQHNAHNEVEVSQ